jgi:hypothetical protein
MTITPITRPAIVATPGSNAAPLEIPLPGRPYIALRIQRIP